MHRLPLIFLLSLGLALSAAAQNIPFDKANFGSDKEGLKEAQKNIKAGNDLYKQGPARYAQAIEPYLKAQQFNPNNAELNFKLGECYLNSPFKSRALPHLEKAYKLDHEIDPDILFMLAQAYHLNMDWDKATQHYKAFRQTIGPKAKELAADVNKRIAECANGVELVKTPARVFIDNAGSALNSTFSEYGPVITADESMMLFTSRRSNTTGGEKDRNLGDYFEDVYISFKGQGGKWQSPMNMGKPINTENHDAVVALSPDGQRLIIYKDENFGDLYECRLNGDQWEKPVSLGKKVNTDFHESSASYAPDGRTIYFVSNRDGGHGGHDIYRATLNAKGKFDDVVNLGPTINTPYDEEGVYMHPDGKTLYFSSKGHNSMGGYDIFKTVFENGRWSKPENLGYPINTPDDDVFFVLSASGRHGYYASEQATGMGGRDIYRITFLGPEKPVALTNEDNLLASLAGPIREAVVAPKVEIKTAQVTILKGVVTDARTGHPIEASIELVDNMRNMAIASFTSNSKSGRYLVSLPAGINYGIAVKADGYLFHSENFDIPASADFQEVIKDIPLKKADVGVKIVLNNIFFDFDKATLRPESTYELDRLTKLMQEMPNLKIELSGHTDNKGAAAYNQSLSENRAKAVVSYLISKGIASGRLTSAGYGLTQPIATNDTEAGRQLNRRTEMKIMGN